MIDILFSIASCCIGILGQACCWWNCFRYCGCIDDKEREVIRAESPRVVVGAVNNNPFTNPGVPKDAHLQSAYF